MKLPQSQLEAIRYFADEDRCIKFVAEQRWPNGVVCPTCGRVDMSYLKTQRRWQCKSAHPKRQFSVKTGTIFEDSPLGLNKWLPAVWIIVNAKNGVSSYEMARTLSITQKSAWFLNHRIRAALAANGGFEKLSGTVQGDETYVGGYKHRDAKHGYENKTAIVGVVENKKGVGQARAFVTKYADATTAMQFLKDHVEAGANLHTDESPIYYNAKRTFKHDTVNHRKREYARGAVTTNSIEGLWNLFKRSHRGTYTHLSAGHLGMYVAEHLYRYNNRQYSDSERFVMWFGGCARRLAYKTLTS